MSPHGFISRGKRLGGGQARVVDLEGDGMGGPRQSLLLGTGEVLGFPSLKYRLDSNVRTRDQP